MRSLGVESDSLASWAFVRTLLVWTTLQGSLTRGIYESSPRPVDGPWAPGRPRYTGVIDNNGDGGTVDTDLTSQGCSSRDLNRYYSLNKHLRTS